MSAVNCAAGAHLRTDQRSPERSGTGVTRADVVPRSSPMLGVNRSVSSVKCRHCAYIKIYLCLVGQDRRTTRAFVIVYVFDWFQFIAI
jgi:hypothetical protein